MASGSVADLEKRKAVMLWVSASELGLFPREPKLVTCLVVLSVLAPSALKLE